MKRLELSGGEALQDRLKEIMEKAGKAGVLRVGFLEGSTYPDGTSVPMVAAIQNFGAPAAGIPPRPFFSNMVREKSPKWGESLGNLAKANDYDIDRTLEQMGEGIKSQLQASIRDFDSVPLAAETAARKGFDKQLIDTGHMQNSVGFEVKS
jgi:hypothetical protein